MREPIRLIQRCWNRLYKSQITNHKLKIKKYIYMLFKYTAIDKIGNETAGSIDTINKDVAISSLQRQGLVISSIISAEEKSFFKREISFFDRVSNKEIVMLSRQISTLFESQVSALRVFKLLGSESSNKILRVALIDVADDIQSGKSISDALSEHNKIFSPLDRKSTRL